MAKLLNDEEMQKLRKEKQLAILKASNKLLEEAKETVMSTDKLSDFDKTERIRQIEDAQNENILKGKTYLQSSKKFVVIYNEETEYYYYIEMSANSGTYQENGIDFSCVSREFSTVEEAQEYCEKHNN